MKRILFVASLIVVSAIAMPVSAKKKKEKNQQAPVEAVAVEEPVILASSADTLSYIAGKTATNGLIPFIQQQYKVDTAYMADFAKGYEEAVAKINDPKYAAYIAGVQIAQMAKQRIFPSMNADLQGTEYALTEELFHKGFTASLKNDNSIYADSTARKIFETKVNAIKKAQQEEYIQQNTSWLKENATKEGVKTTPSGLQYKVLTAGTGETPKATDKVTVKYEGKLIDGTVFDSSYKRNPQTSSFKCNEVIKGWTEALTMMPVGSKWELYIPQELAYGERPAGKIKPYSTLIFTVELEGIESEKKPEAKTEAKTAETKAKAKTAKITKKK